jgi:hypothetical protein
MAEATLRRAPTSAGRAVGPTVSRWVAGAGAVYVAAWIIGLLAAPAAPGATASDAEIHAFFVAHHSATLIQALLVHGIAGVALAVFVVCLVRAFGATAPARVRNLVLGAGLGAAGVSLVQFGMELALNRHVANHGDVGGTAALFHAVNVADTIKLILLGVAIAAATRMAAGAGAWPAWLRVLGMALLPILFIGGLAFVIDAGALSAVLTLSLFLLLLWVGAASVTVARATRPAVRA